MRNRGFGRERHTPMKLGALGLSVMGFVLGWLGFNAAHPAPPEPPPATATPVAATTASSPGEEATPTLVPTRARTSRGS